jgi:spermidine synthase
MLEKTFSKNYEYTAVELDESVIYLMSKYVLPELKSSIEVLQANALAYVQQTSERFDLIAMDIFQDDVVPAEFESDTFLQALKRILHEDGVLCYNRLSAKRADRVKTKNFYEQAFLPNFPDGTYLDVGGNWMLLNRKDIVK